MKLVRCIVRPEKIDELVAALQRAVSGLTISEVRGHGREKAHVVVYRGVEISMTLLPKLMFEMVVEDNRVEDVIQIVSQSARTGIIGDGRVFVQGVEEAYHVRTGFMDLD